MEQELVVMEIICNAGEARSLSYEALRLAREQNLKQQKRNCCKPESALTRRI